MALSMKIISPMVAMACLLAAAPVNAWSERYDAAFSATMAAPGDVDALLAFAEIALREGDYEGAITALERLLLIRPDLPEVQVQLGGLYLRLGATAQAALYAESALQSGRLSDAARAEAERLLGMATDRAARHRLGASLTVAGGYQTNANAGPADRSVTVGDTTYDLTSDERARPDGNVFAAAALTYAYDPDLESGLTIEAALAGAYTRQFEVTDYHVGTAGLAVGPRIPMTGRREDGATLWLHALADLSTLGSDLYSTGFGGGLTLTAPVARALWLDAILDARQVVYHDGDVATSASDQTGFGARAALQLRYRVFDNLWLIGGGRGATHGADDASLAHTAVGGVAGVAVPFGAPLAAPPWSVDVVYEHTASFYAEPDADLDPDTTRADTDSRVAGLVRMPIRDDLAIVLSGGFTRRASNIEIYTWSGAFASAGISYALGASP